MGKVITERPRWGHRDPNAKTGMSVRWEGPEAEYNIPTKDGRGKLRTKMFSDLLGPVLRWTRKQVGRPWSKVYSELCQTFDKRRTTHAHVIEHICGRIGWVALHVEKRPDGFWRAKGSLLGSYPPEYYVHPRTGLLCFQLRPRFGRKSKPAPNPDEVEIDGPMHVFSRIRGIWYVCRTVITEIPDPAWQPGQEKKREMKTQVAETRKQAGKKELKLLRLLLRERGKRLE